MSTSDLPAASSSAPRRPPPGRWRGRSAWAGPYGSEPGPRPPLARVAALGYAAITLTLLKLGIQALVPRWGDGDGRSIAFLLPIALYSGGLAYGAERLRSRSVRRPASPWVCVPLLLHAACGLLGASAFVMGAFSFDSRAFRDFALPAALLGMLLGWLPLLSPILFARRGGVLFLVGLAGPVVLLVVITLTV